MLLVSVAMVIASSSPKIVDFRKWGLEAMDSIYFRYYRPSDHYYSEVWENGKAGDAPCYNWTSGVLLSALASAAKADSRYKARTEEYADAMERYWNPAPPVPGYDVLPMPKDADRYYDDNAWMVMAMVEAYQVTHQRRFLERAKAALTFALSGEDDRLGGGIVWRESDKASKNTCSNAPTAAACLAVYEVTKDRKLVAAAQRLYEWTKKNLQDPADHLMWDNINFEGKVEKTKWTYNTALMIRTAVGLHKDTHQTKYLTDARDMALASRAHWLTPEGALADDGKFAFLLVEASILLHDDIHDARLTELTVPPLRFLYEKARSADGFYPGKWNGKASGARFELIDQVSAARAFLVAAESKKAPAKIVYREEVPTQHFRW